jgi:hypothetical protein
MRCGEVITNAEEHPKPCLGPKRTFTVVVKVIARGQEVPDIASGVDLRLNGWDVEDYRVTSAKEEQS